MARETTNRQLRLWEQHNWVRLDRGGIFILSVKALERITESTSEDTQIDQVSRSGRRVGWNL
jgi:hypothetical protein